MMVKSLVVNVLESFWKSIGSGFLPSGLGVCHCFLLGASVIGLVDVDDGAGGDFCGCEGGRICDGSGG